MFHRGFVKLVSDRFNKIERQWQTLYSRFCNGQSLQGV
nr:MAG TPA: hypothetical protein [Caudoviricetes sp.]